MLKHRLLSGILMTIFFVGLMLIDGWIDGSITADLSDNSVIQGTILCVLIVLLIILGQFELLSLTKAKGFKIFLPFNISASALLASSWYISRMLSIEQHLYLYFICAFIICGLFLNQYLKFGTKDVMVNCGVNCFFIFYLGLLAAFSVGLRVDFGLWPLFMFVFVIKTSDIGAYTAGSLWGKHKFSPIVSPKKTWEGMAGAIVVAVLFSVLFAIIFDIMPLMLACVFGVIFAFIGQLSDLAESLIKRDTEQKDSAASVPGFGGILDVLDSVLLSAPFAYLFFRFLS